MPLNFYPHEDDLDTSTLQEKLEVLTEAAERFKAYVLDAAQSPQPPSENKKMAPRDLPVAFNWDEIAKLLRAIRELPESTHDAKLIKAEQLSKLAEIYEDLRAAKMPKLEAVRIALVNEASQLRVS